MTKKDYELIAEAIAVSRIKFNDYRAIEPNEAIKRVVYELSENLRNENGKFDVEKFYKACGLTTQDFMEDYRPR